MAFTEIQTKSLKTLFMERITTMIISEELKIGEKLPPERDIAQKMNICYTRFIRREVQETNESEYRN